jgi:hypothetical protein
MIQEILVALVTVKDWEDSGLIFGLPPKHKEELVKHFNKMTPYYNSFEPNYAGIYLPVCRRVFSILRDEDDDSFSRLPSKIQKSKSLRQQVIDSVDPIELVNYITAVVKNFLQPKSDCHTELDWEVEICQLAALGYITFKMQEALGVTRHKTWKDSKHAP